LNRSRLRAHRRPRVGWGDPRVSPPAISRRRLRALVSTQPLHIDPPVVNLPPRTDCRTPDPRGPVHAAPPITRRRARRGDRDPGTRGRRGAAADPRHGIPPRLLTRDLLRTRRHLTSSRSEPLATLRGLPIVRDGSGGASGPAPGYLTAST
jgi:hypothetical protein